MKALLLVATATLLILSSGGVSQSAQAQEAGTAVVIPLETLRDLPLEHSGGFLDVLVDGHECGMIRFDDPAALARDSDLSAPLDRPTLFPVCSQSGATLTLVTGEGRVLPQRTVTRGERIEVTSLEPEASPTGGATVLVVNRGVLAYVRQTEWLDVSADGTLCGRVMVAEPAEKDAEGNAVFRLDAPGVPAECSRTGARLTFVDELGFRLFREPLVLQGARTMLAALGGVPPTTGGGSSTPLPPSTGTGASAGEGNTALAWMAPAAALLALLFVGGAALRQRRRA
jgi:hypothetical protein